MRDLPALLRAAERRVNANVWPNTAENAGADSHLASIPANRDTDTDLLLIEAADRIASLEKAIKWVVNDAAYKPPEVIGDVANRWLYCLRSALNPNPTSGAEHG